MPPTAWVLSLLAVIGLLFLWRGIRGAPQLTSPYCARCRYDLRATLRQGRDQCPECGNPLDFPGAVRFGRRSRSAVCIFVGLLLLLPMVLYSTNVIVKRSTGFQWRQLQPTSSLIAVLDDSKAAGPASTVLELRYMNGKLSDQDVADLVDFVIDSMNRDGASSLSRNVNGLIQMIYRDNRISKDQQRRLIEALFNLPVRLSCRPQVRSGQSLDFHIRGLSSSLGRRLQLAPSIVIDQATLSGAQVPLGPHTGFNGRFPVLADPGTHTLEMQLEISIVDTGFRSSVPDDPIVRHRWDTTVSIPVTVLPMDEFPFRRVSDPSVVDDFRASIDVARAVAERDVRPGIAQVELTLQLEKPQDLALSYQVIARVDGREERLGDFLAQGKSFSCSCLPLNTASRHSGLLRMAFDAELRIPAGIEQIDVILRPDLERAERNAQLQDLLDAQIVIEGIPLEFLSLGRSRAGRWPERSASD
jgi:hypothetical protein